MIDAMINATPLSIFITVAIMHILRTAGQRQEIEALKQKVQELEKGDAK